MPKSFLVKNKLRSKSCASDDENLPSGDDELGRECEETRIVWRPGHNEEKKGRIKALTVSAPAGESMPERFETEKVVLDPKQSPETKLVNHEKLELDSKNMILSRLNTQPILDSAIADSKQCERCKRTYTTNAALAKHQRYYCNFFQTKSFTCKYCDKVYLSLGALKMHIRTHTLPCRCVICGKAFSRPWLLQGHIRTHTGEKPYECSNCNRAFADRSNLRAHLQTHSDVKKYRCDRCSKTFSRMSLLMKHQHASCSTMKA